MKDFFGSLFYWYHKSMPYPSVPTESKSKINAAATLLARGKIKSGKTSSDDINKAIELVNAWRVSHSYPLKTLNVNLRRKVKGYKGAVVAQRLKRMPTILDKLVREPTMQLTTMQDLGGVRAIVADIKTVNKITEKYKSGTSHELIDEKDYIAYPRGTDGYRSHHLVFKYKSNVDAAQQYNGLRIEMQIRTKLQHNWATAVETMGAILGQQLKSRQGEKDWLQFFAATSSAFAHIEGTALVPGYERLSKEETFKLVKKRERALNAIEKFSAFSRAMSFVNRDENKPGRPSQGYYLLELNLENHRVTITPYKSEDATRASQALERLEKEAKNNTYIDALLVSVGPLDELSKAYPNYFLDVREFVGQLQKIISLA
jgi:ppGpp synthetase/RelA/SpoT-type nucleotidyltranferase